MSLLIIYFIIEVISNFLFVFRKIKIGEISLSFASVEEATLGLALVTGGVAIELFDVNLVSTQVFIIKKKTIIFYVP